jgi:Ser-tRNA(Ala) deacylase AlaX
MEAIVTDADTDLTYLSNTYQYEAKAKILKFDKDDKGPFLVLDHTIFYPQGGGQPSDLGQILLANENSVQLVFNITFVSFNNGRVHHYYTCDTDANQLSLAVGSQVDLKIDSTRRITNSKSHTSGHLLASIVEKLAPELMATKGYHFPEGPYIEFKGKLTTMSSDELISRVHSIVKEDILASRQLKVTQRDDDSVSSSRKQMRFVQIDGYSEVPCGGTHLNNVSELKDVIIRKIQFPKGNTKIAYSYS